MALVTESGSDTLPIGSPAPPFSLPGVDGKIYSLDSFKAAKALVISFTCNHCPYAKAYEDRFMAIIAQFAPKAAAFVAICANDAAKYPDDSFDNMKLHARERGFNFPYLHDESQSVAKAYGAVCTPHLFVLDAGRRLAYEGRIDDNWKIPADAKNHDLRDALAAVLEGKPAPHPNTSPMGCSIKWK